MSADDLRSEFDAAMTRWALVADGEAIDTLNGCVVFVRRGTDPLVLKIVGKSEPFSAAPHQYLVDRSSVACAPSVSPLARRGGG